MSIIYRIHLFGSPQLEKVGQQLSDSGSRKGLALLAYLACQRKPVSRSYLAALLWPDKPEDRGRRNLSRELSQLAVSLPDCLEGNYHTVQFKPGAEYWLDIWTFEALVKDTDLPGFQDPQKFWKRATSLTAQSGSAESVEANLVRRVEALKLYRGDFSAGLVLDDCPEFEGWLVKERELWRQQVVEVLKWLSGYFIGQRQDEPARKYLEQWLSLEPWNEDVHRQLMILLVRNGQRNAALAQYETCRRVLAETLRIEPADETVRLFQQIRLGEAPDVSPPASVLPQEQKVPPQAAGLSQPLPPHNLPATIRSFLGREVELTHLVTYLQNPDIRLVSLVGPGGIGKTELALQTARALLPHFFDGIWFVPLAGVRVPATSPEEIQEAQLGRLHQIIITAMTTALGVNLSGVQPPEAQIKAYLADKCMVLVIDNFEHLTAGTALWTNLLAAAPGLKLLLTSRERLHLPGEWVLELPGLPYPPPPPPQPDWGQAEVPDPDHHWQSREGLAELGRFEAVSLLVSRARQTNAHFTLTPGNSLAILKLCRLVEGLPLGLELLAGQMRSLTPDQVLESLSANLSQLQTDLRLPERHRSFQAVFEWSWLLLPVLRQEHFARLSVFRGGFTAEAAQAVIGAGRSDLLALLDRSFIRRSENGRYDIHELLRQFGAEKLQQMGLAGEETTTQIRDRHARHYARLLRQCQDRLYPNQDPETGQKIAQELNNIQAMWQWAIHPARPPLLTVLAQAQTALFYYYFTHGFFQEGLAIFGQAVERLRKWRTPFSEVALLPGSDELLEATLARLLIYQSRFAGQRGNYPLALTAGRQALGVARQAQVHDIQVEAHLALADVLMKQGDYPGARETLQQALPVAQTLEQPFPAVRTQDLLSWTYWYQADPVQAAHYASQALAGYRRLNHLPRVAGVLGLLSKIYTYRGDYLLSQSCLEEALAIYQQLDHQVGQLPVLGNLGILYRLVGAYPKSQAYLEQSLALTQALGQAELRMYNLEELSRLYHARGDGTAAYEYARQALELAQTLGSPLGIWGAETCIGNALAALQDWEEAEQAHRAAWEQQQALGPGNVGLENLAGLAGIVLAQGQAEAALEWVEPILAWLAAHEPASVSQLLAIQWICYQVLQANEDPRAAELLQTAYAELQRRATALTDPELRHSFLEGISAHRNIVKAVTGSGDEARQFPD